MFNRIRGSWQLFKQSCSVLNNNKKLLVFPVVNLMFTFFLLLFFLSPVFFVPSGHAVTSEAHWEYIYNALFDESVTVTENGTESDAAFSPLFYVLWAAAYMVSMFLMTFLNTVFYNEIIQALNGEPVSVRNGFRFAMTRLKPIAMWSLFAGIVGLILRAIEERLDVVGRIIIGLIGVVWSVASVFAIPVIIRDEQASNPIKVLKSSALLIKERWGEGLAGYVGIRGIGALIVLPWTAVVFLIAYALIESGLEPVWVISCAVAVYILGCIAVTYILDVINRIFLCALYVYAAEGSMPGPFDAAAAESVWKVKKGKKVKDA